MLPALRAGCFQLRVILQEENENCIQMPMGRGRKKEGKSPEDQDYKGLLLFRAQIGVLHRKHKRRLCFVGP